MRTFLHRSIVYMTCLALYAQTVAFALPTGWEVIEGSASFELNDNVLNVITATDKTVINYISFNLASGETVNFIMPGVGSSVLNRVMGGNTSVIEGVINSNGRLGLINTAGIVVANAAQINSAALFASTLNIADDSFFSDVMTLNKDSDNTSFLINQGAINITDGGYALLVSNSIANTGSIIAEDGTIHMTVGDKVTFHLSDNSSVEVSIDQEISKMVDELNTAIINHGDIKAHRVELRAKLSENLLKQSVNNTGIIQGTAIADVGGKIVIMDEQGSVFNSGLVYAGATKDNATAGKITLQGNSAYNSGGLFAQSGLGKQGGTIHMLGDVVMNEGGLIDVSGDLNGGTALIGGDFQGTGDVQRATLNMADPYTVVLADAYQHGDGGKVIFWSDKDTYFYGSVYARGGLETGNGGFAEISGKQFLDMQGDADLTAGNEWGSKGTLLLDPTNINIVEFDPNDLNPTLWLDASDASTITSSGGFVTQWRDKSGNGNHANSQANNNRPQTGINTLNGNNVLTFDGVDDVLTITDDPSLDNSNGMSFFVVDTPTDNDALPRGIFAKRVNSGAPASQYSYTLFYYGSNRLTVDFHTQNNRFDTTNGYAPNNTYMHSIIYDGTLSSGQRISLYDNTVLNRTATESSATLPDTASDLYIGMLNYNYGYGHQGDISEMLIFQTALSDTDRYLVNQYQAAKWGQTLGTTIDQFSEITDGYLEYLTQTADVSLLADQNITIEDMSDNLLALGNRNLTLTATNGNIIFNDTNDVLRTEGGDITLNAGGFMTLGQLNTRGASGTINTGNVTLNGTGSGNISLASGNIGGTLDITTATGGDITVNNTNVVGAVDIQNAANTNGDIIGTGNTFNSTTILDTNDVSNGHINMSANFVGDVELYGDQILITDTAGDLSITNFTSGASTLDSVVNALSAGADVNISTYDIGSGGGGFLEVNANNDINYTKLTSPWVLNERLVLNSTNGGDITLNDVWTSQFINGRSAAYSVGAVGTGTYVSSNGGDLIINNLDSSTDVNVTSGFNNVYVGSTSGTAAANVGNLNITATGDIVAYGDINGTVTASGSRVWMNDTAGNFNSTGITASGSTGWNGASDETLVIISENGDVRGTGFTTSGAGNIRLQTGTVGGGACATCSIDVNNVQANQNVAMYAKGADGGTSINVGGTSNVGGHITATGYANTGFYTATTGDVNIATTSGDIETAMVWSGDDVVLTANNGSITQNVTVYGTGYNNGKTVYANDDISLTALGGVGSSVNTGVVTGWKNGDVTVRAQGATGGTSVQLNGYVGGNLDVQRNGAGNTTGDVYLGTSVGVSDNLEDVDTVLDVHGTTLVRSGGDVYLNGYYTGAVTVTADRLITNIDRGNLNIASLTLNSGNSDIKVLRGSILGGNITSIGNLTMQAGTFWDLDKNKYINLTNVNTTGNLVIEVTGSSTGSESGTSVSITGSTSGTTTVTDESGNAPLGSVSTP